MIKYGTKWTRTATGEYDYNITIGQGYTQEERQCYFIVFDDKSSMLVTEENIRKLFTEVK